MNRTWSRIGAVAVAIASVRCGSASNPAAPAAATRATATVKSTADPSAVFLAALNASRGVHADADVDGFRVHPDPSDSGVIQLVEGDPLVINAAGLASVPPAPQTYLIVNWGDDGNERIGCGPCRLTHRYVAGRYTVVATTDDLQPQAPGSATTGRSITLTVNVAPAVAPAGHRSVSPFAGLAFQPPFVVSPGTGVIFIPTIPDDITIDSSPLVCASPATITVATTPTPVPGGMTLAFTAVSSGLGSCTATINSHDAAGDVFHDVATLFVLGII